MDLSLNNLNFCIEIMYNFTFACDHESETMLDEFLYDNYPMPNDEWFAELKGTENDESWNGYVLSIIINPKVTLFVEFKPDETAYFFNETYLGNSGGHSFLSLLKWNEFNSIIKENKNSDLLFFLLLPLVVGELAQKEIIKKSISLKLRNTPFKENHIPELTNYLINHLIFEDDDDVMFEEHHELGLISKRRHSVRNLNNSASDIKNINKIIETAIQRA